MKTILKSSGNCILLLGLFILYCGNVISQVSVPSPSIYLAFDTNDPAYDSVTKKSGTKSGTLQQVADRFGNAQRAIRFASQGAGVCWTSTIMNSVSSVSFWVYVDDPSTIPTGAVPFSSSDKTIEFYNWTDGDNNVLRGLARKKATVGFNRFIQKTDGTRVPWYLWSYRPAQFNEKGWYHIFVVQGQHYTRLIMYKPNSGRVYSYNWLGAQDFSKRKYLYIGGFLDKFGPNGAFDDFKFYNSELSDDQIDYLHTAEKPVNRFLRITNKESGKYINVSGGVRDDGALLIQYSTGNGNDEWRLNYVGNNNEYRIENLHSKKIMVVKDGSIEVGKEIIQYHQSGSDNEIWQLEYSNLDTKYFRLKNKRSGKYLSVYQNSTSEGAKLVQENPGEKSQYWKFELSAPIRSNTVLEPGLYRFKNKHSGLYLDVQDRSTAVNKPLIQQKNAGDLSNTNLWSVTKGNANGYRLKNIVSQYYMKTPGNTISLYSILQGENASYNEDVWQLIDTGTKGEYYLRNVSTYMYAIVLNSSTGEGAKVVQYNSADTENAIWIPERFYYSDPPIKNGYYTLTNLRSQKFMNVENGSTSDLARIIQFSTIGKNGIFDIENNEFGYVTIRNIQSNKYVVVRNGSLSEGEELIQYGNTIPQANGQWKIERTSSTTGAGYELYCLSSGLQVVVKDGSKAEGIPLIQYRTGADNGIWQIKTAPEARSRNITTNALESDKSVNLSVHTDFQGDQITVESNFTEAKDLLFVISDIQGRVLYKARKSAYDGNSKMCVNGFNSNLSSGKIYILSITSDNGDINYSTKVIY